MSGRARRLPPARTCHSPWCSKSSSVPIIRSGSGCSGFEPLALRILRSCLSALPAAKAVSPAVGGAIRITPARPMAHFFARSLNFSKLGVRQKNAPFSRCQVSARRPPPSPPSFLQASIQTPSFHPRYCFPPTAGPASYEPPRSARRSSGAQRKGTEGDWRKGKGERIGGSWLGIHP